MKEGALQQRPTPEAMTDPSTMPLGIRAIAFVVRHLLTLVLATVLFGALGGLVGFLLPRAYVDRAIVEVGLRFMNEPLEHPMVVAARLTGYLERASQEIGDESAEVEVDIRRAQKTNALTRLLEVRVESSSADSARAIIERGVQVLVKEHEEAHEHEHKSLLRQLTRLEALAERLRAAIPETEDPAELEAALSKTILQISGTRTVSADVRFPKTRVVSHAVAPHRLSSRVPVLAFGGLVFGGLFGLALASWRDATKRRP